MSYSLKDVFYLDAQVNTGTAASDAADALDLSAYVDPIAKGRSRGVGLAIYKVHFDVSDDTANQPVKATTTGQLRCGFIANPGIGSFDTASGTTLDAAILRASNDLMVAGFDYCAPATSTNAYPNMYQYVMPSTEVPYIVVRDSIALCIDVVTAFSDAATVSVRLECAQVSLDQATLNQLLRTQTV